MIKESGIVEMYDELACLVAPFGSLSGDARWNAAQALRGAAAIIAELLAERSAVQFMGDKNYKLWADERDARIAAESSLHRVSAWQPIETAPSDGTPILAYSTEGVVYVAWLTSSGWCFFQNFKNDRWCFDPTHWMKLPPLPAVADTNADAPGNVGLVRGISSDQTSLNITGLDTGAVKTAESSHSPSTLNAETE